MAIWTDTAQKYSERLWMKPCKHLGKRPENTVCYARCLLKTVCYTRCFLKTLSAIHAVCWRHCLLYRLFGEDTVCYTHCLLEQVESILSSVSCILTFQKKLYGPFLWIGFNFLKATKSSFALHVLLCTLLRNVT